METPLELLQRCFGYDEFRGFQAEVINHVIEGRNALVLMPTGGGKSLCYQIPALLRNGVGVVVSPLIALMQDQVQALIRRGIPAACLNAHLSFAEAERVRQSLVDGQIKLIYVSPERLTQASFVSLLEKLRDRQGLALFAIDEAHCIAEWGHDFRPEYRRLTLLNERFLNIPRIALTASADRRTRQEIAEQLSLERDRWFIGSFNRPNIHYAVLPRLNLRQQVLTFLRQYDSPSSGILYCQSRRQADLTAQSLERAGWPCLPYHAGLDADTRHRHQEAFLNRPGWLMAATIAFGMGVDKPDVRFVLHLECPRTIEGYYQETGRAGRDGRDSKALLLYDPRDLAQLRWLAGSQYRNAERRRHDLSRLDAIEAFATHRGCRRQALLAHFDEEHPGHCASCDVCNPDFQNWAGKTGRHHQLPFVVPEKKR